MLDQPRLALREANRRVLAFQLAHTDQPRWRELALARAWLGLLTDGHLRRAARAALTALGHPPTWRRVWQFTWTWWQAGATHFLHSYQADRLTPAWCAAQVDGAIHLPAEGAVLISVHHFNQRLGWVRLSQAVERLGLISALTLRDPAEPATAQPARARRARMDDTTALEQLTTLYRRTFGDRVFRPPAAARGALRLLEGGGTVILTPDGYLGPDRGQLLGRTMGVGRGAPWLARHSGRPIVPFCVVPQGKRWRLWCGAPIPPTQCAVERALEECIRRAPTSWMLWPDWFDAPSRAC